MDAAQRDGERGGPMKEWSSHAAEPRVIRKCRFAVPEWVQHVVVLSALAAAATAVFLI